MKQRDSRPGDPLGTDPDPFVEVPENYRNPNVVEREFNVRFNPNPGGEDPEILKGYRTVKKFD